MGEMPEPLVPADTDVTNLDGFMLNVERLLASELVAIATAEACWAALMLWCRAWKQIPAGSLPNDDRILASFSGAGKRWSKVRRNAMHGFVLCADGRLYHRFLCKEALRAIGKKKAFQERRERDQKRLNSWREKRQRNGDETRFNGEDETQRETRFVAEGTGTGTGTGTGRDTPKGGSVPDLSEPETPERARPGSASLGARSPYRASGSEPKEAIKPNGHDKPRTPPPLTAEQQAMLDEMRASGTSN